MPGLLERLFAAPSGGDAHRRRRLLVLDAADILARAGGGRALLIALEDLHWADDLALEIVAALARRLAELPILVVATYRSDELYPRIPMRDWRSRLLAQRLAEEARLPRLDVSAVATMAALLLGSELPVAQDVVMAIYARSDGIPLHVEELLGVAIGSIRGRADAIRAADVPDTLADAVRSRLARRSARAQRIAQAAAVYGRSFDIDSLAAVVAWSVDPVATAVAELADHFIVVPSVEPGRFDFRHALIRDAIHATVDAPTRRRLHSRVADVAAAEGLDEGFCSIHFEAAGRRDEAYRAALSAARRAMTLWSRHEACELYQRALRNRPPHLSELEHARLLEEHATAAASADDNASAAESLVEAQEHYRRAGRPVDACRLLAPLVAARHLLGDGLEERARLLRGGLDELDAVARAAGVEGRSEGSWADDSIGDAEAEGPSGAPEVDTIDARLVRARLLSGLCAAYMLDRRLDESIEYGEAALRLAVELGDEATELDTLATLGSDLVFAGRMDEGWAMFEAAVGRARAAQRETEAARTYRMIGSCASVLVEYERAERWLREGIDYAERVELWNHRHYMAAHLGHVLWATGRWDEGERVAAHALADGRGGITTRITALHVLGYVALGRGDLTAARRHLDQARELGESMRELQRLSPALWGLAEVDLLAGDVSAAIDGSERGFAASAVVADAAYLFPFLVTGTRARLAARDVAAAERWVADVSAALRRRSIPGTLPAIDHAVGLLALARGATGAARSALRAARHGWLERTRVWEGTWASLDLALVETRSNRLVEADRLVAEVLDLARTLGSAPLVDRAAALERRIRARHPTPDPWAPLTAREYEIARAVAGGRTNAEIAAELGLSPKTVAAHVEHILNKLGASRRAEIAAWATAAATRDGAAAPTGLGPNQGRDDRTAGRPSRTGEGPG
ncbi:MAG: hypothetical protein KatS3mg065_0094 [Chloroflexota bacterium]|nr:MAG: hypothetical protein KatS3mg065_0094 [Chloroflexota bacterium]